MVKISDTNTIEFTFNKTVERESELISIIESYIALGKNVKKPLLIRCSQGWGQDEISAYLYDNKIDKKGRRLGLGVSGHPLKQGGKYFDNHGQLELISNHPELTSTFQTPLFYDPSCPPLFFVHTTIGWDNSWNPAYCLECVEKLKIPFIYFASTQWVAGDFDNPQGKTLEGPDILTEFESVLYAPTVKGWLQDMAEKTELPNKNRIIKVAIEPNCALDAVHYESYKIICDISQKMDYQVFEPRIQHLLDYAASIKDLESYDHLYDPDFTGLFLADKTGAGIPYLLERVMDFYSSMFYLRIIWPDDTKSISKLKKHLGSQSIYNLGLSFMKFIENTDDAWVFDLSKPVPENIIKEVQELLSH